jgi:hypothetical protein|tara:strand:- start:884 stop:1120 length:237 start_codon:yes stop_codon:yes gene_type:complete
MVGNDMTINEETLRKAGVTSITRLIVVLDTICTLHEKQASLDMIDDVIKYARELLNETTINNSYIQTVLHDIDGDKNE